MDGSEFEKTQRSKGKRRRRRPAKLKPVHKMTAEEKEDLYQRDQARLARKLKQQQHPPKDKKGRVRQDYVPPAPMLRIDDEAVAKANLPHHEEGEPNSSDEELYFSDSQEDEGLEGIPNLMQRMASNEAPMKDSEADTMHLLGKSHEELVRLLRHTKNDKAYWEARAKGAEAQLEVQNEMLARGKRREKQLRSTIKALERAASNSGPSNGKQQQQEEDTAQEPQKRQRVEQYC